MTATSEVKARQTSEVAFVLSLISGIVMVAGSLTYLVIFYSGRQFFYGMMGGFGMYNGGYPYMMSGIGYPQFMSGFVFVGLVAGILVTVFAMLLRTASKDRKTWAVLIIVFSIVGLLGIGGFYIGPLLGIVGGALALAA